MRHPMQPEPPETSSSQQVSLQGSSLSAEQGGTVSVAGGHIIQAGAGATVIIGVQALGEMMRGSKAIRQAVLRFSSNFQAACTHVDIMGDYKDLHDLLHQLQFQCYSTIVREATRFPDETSLEALDLYQHNIRDIISQFEAVIALKRVDSAESLWVGQITLANTELRTAVDNTDPTVLKNAIRRLKHLLSTQPVRVNDRLKSAAASLQLPGLLIDLQSIQAELLANMNAPNEGLQPSLTDNVMKFQAGLDALVSLHQRLSAVLTDHTLWQDIDSELRLIETMVELDPGELELSWQIMKEKAMRIYGPPNSEAWALKLQQQSASLDEALVAGNPLKVRQVFRNYRHEAGGRFYKVDLDLKALCSELRGIGEPLARIASDVLATDNFHQPGSIP